MLIQDMPSLRPSQSRTLDNCTVETILPNADQQQEFQRQLELLIRQHRSYPSIVTWVIYNEGWGQNRDDRSTDGGDAGDRLGQAVLRRGRPEDVAQEEHLDDVDRLERHDEREQDEDEDADPGVGP